VIPRPLDDLERAMPLAECWLQELQPVRMPINIREPERELQPFPPLEIPETVPVELPAVAVQEPMEQVVQMPMEFEELLVESEAKVEDRSADSLDD
jgi:carbon dioxide concentrating mechanism protein CcmO